VHLYFIHAMCNSQRTGADVRSNLCSWKCRFCVTRKKYDFQIQKQQEAFGGMNMEEVVYTAQL